MKYFIRYKNVLYLLLRSNVCKVVSPLWRLAGGGGAELSSVIYYFSFRFFVGSFQSIGARCEKTLFVPPFVWLSFTTQHSATQNHNVTKTTNFNVSSRQGFKLWRLSPWLPSPDNPCLTLAWASQYHIWPLYVFNSCSHFSLCNIKFYAHAVNLNYKLQTWTQSLEPQQKC